MNLIKKEREILKETQTENKFKCDILKDSVESLTNKIDYVKYRVSCLQAMSFKDNDKFKNILLNGTHSKNKIPKKIESINYGLGRRRV